MNPASLSLLADRWAMASVTSSNRALAFSYRSTSPLFLVATVDDPAILVRAVPDLGSKESSALAAFYLAGENAHAAVPAALLLAPRHLRLHHLEGFRGDDGGMALFHEVAGDLPRVLDHLLRKEVRREGLLDRVSAP